MSNTNYRQWLRRYRVIVGGLDVSSLRCAFKIDKALEETPDYAQIVITNLKQGSITQVKAGDKVTVEVGYEGGNFGLIFSGEVVQPYVERDEGVDTNLVLICQDSDVFLNSAFTAVTLEKGSTLSNVVDTCASGGVGKNIISDSISQTAPFIRGRVLFGKSADYLRQAAYATDTQFFVEDGEVNIVGAQDYASGVAVVLNSETGMIEEPSQTDDGVSVKCLINPSIKLNTLIQLNTADIQRQKVTQKNSEIKELSADGIYRVVKLTYEGDTHGDTWYCEVEGITQDGANPAGVGSSGGAADAGEKSSLLYQGSQAIKDIWTR